MMIEGTVVVGEKSRVCLRERERERVLREGVSGKRGDLPERQKGCNLQYPEEGNYPGNAGRKSVMISVFTGFTCLRWPPDSPAKLTAAAVTHVVDQTRQRTKAGWWRWTAGRRVGRLGPSAEVRYRGKKKQPRAAVTEIYSIASAWAASQHTDTSK